MFRDTRKGTAQDDAADNNGDAEQPKTYAGNDWNQAESTTRGSEEPGKAHRSWTRLRLYRSTPGDHQNPRELH